MTPPTEQFIVNTPGILLTGYVWKGTYNMSHCGIIFRENASGIIHIRNKVSLVSGEIIMDTMNFEYWCGEICAVELKILHSDNSFSTDDMFREYFREKYQTNNWSSVGDKPKNYQLDRAIHTINYLALNSMVLIDLYWDKNDANNIDFWNFSTKNSVWLYNYLEFWVTGCYWSTTYNVWGCNFFVLKPKLQYGKNNPKWTRWSLMSKILGFCRGIFPWSIWLEILTLVMWYPNDILRLMIHFKLCLDLVQMNNLQHYLK